MYCNPLPPTPATHRGPLRPGNLHLWSVCTQSFLQTDGTTLIGEIQDVNLHKDGEG